MCGGRPGPINVNQNGTLCLAWSNTHMCARISSLLCLLSLSLATLICKLAEIYLCQSEQNNRIITCVIRRKACSSMLYYFLAHAESSAQLCIARASARNSKWAARSHRLLYSANIFLMIAILCTGESEKRKKNTAQREHWLVRQAGEGERQRQTATTTTSASAAYFYILVSVNSYREVPSQVALAVHLKHRKFELRGDFGFLSNWRNVSSQPGEPQISTISSPRPVCRALLAD